jgi:error-prone DNA polymerase
MYLNNHTYYSYRYGCFSPQELLKHAQQHGIQSLAVTDINSTSACLDFIRLAPKYGIKPTVGIDFRNGAQQLFIALAHNNQGFQEINAYLSSHIHRGESIPGEAPPFEHASVIYPYAVYKGQPLPPNSYVGLSVYDLNTWRFSGASLPQEKLVALNTFTFRHKKDFNAHRLLRAVDNNMLLSKLPLSEQGTYQHTFLTPSQLTQAYQDYPFLLTQAENILQRTTVHFGFGEDTEPQNLHTYTGSASEDIELLKKLCKEGQSYRYPNSTPELEARIEKEIDIISQKGYVSYFLISWDLVRYARNKGYFYVGRGSGANSVVAYILRITDVDPIDLDLFFERFINLYRKNPPDFDIDFSWADRDDVTHYLFDKYEHVSLLGTYNTFQYRATVRELAKVFGLPKREADILSSGRFVYERLDQLAQLVIRYSQYIQDFPNYLSIHAGGILISEKPIHYFTATFMPPKGFPTTQFDMIVAEDVGLYKYDILSQRGLGKIKDSVSIIQKNHPEVKEVDVHDMKKLREDPEIKNMLKQGKAIGCFYVESPAMRMLLQKLQVQDYLGLVAASSVIRPGVAQSGMMREYILRFRDPSRRPPADDVMMKLMPETFGVMVYQEDVIKVAHYFAGLSLGQADMLRRGMSGKFRSREEFQQVKQAFFDNCKTKGYSDELTSEVWRQTESFAGYAFAKGHSASYAVESYQSLYLKAHYPIEYMTATINNGGGFYSTELYLNEARMHGADIEPPCINTSEALSIVQGKTIYLGLHRIRSLDLQAIKTVLDVRQKKGMFESLGQFLIRVPIGIEQVVLLIRAGAFRFTGKSKKALLWEAHFVLGKAKARAPKATLFEPQPKEYVLPPLLTEPFEDAFDQIELLGFPLCSPFLLLLNPPHEDTLLAEELPKHIGKEVLITGYLIHIKNTKTSRGELMHFGTFLDARGDFIDTVHFPPYTSQYPFRGKGIYEVHGKVVEEFGAISIEVNTMHLKPLIQDPRYNEMSVYERQMLQSKKKKRMTTEVES